MGEVQRKRPRLTPFGEVAEWSIASDLKSDDAAMYPEVRILSSPFLRQHGKQLDCKTLDFPIR
jgi:hypothetical protein